MTWIAGLLRRRTARVLGLILGVALTVTLIALNLFVHLYKSTQPVLRQRAA